MGLLNVGKLHCMTCSELDTVFVTGKIFLHSVSRLCFCEQLGGCRVVSGTDVLGICGCEQVDGCERYQVMSVSEVLGL